MSLKQMKTTVDRLREKALLLLLENESLCFAISPSGKEGRLLVEKTRNQIQSMNKKNLQEYISRVEREIKDLRQKYVVKAKSSELIEFLKAGKESPPGQIFFPPIAQVRRFFHDYSKVLEGSNLLPAHARICFDYQGIGPNGESVRGVRTLEWTFYEDMAALWNLLCKFANVDSPETKPNARKTHYALCRATVAAAIYFVEAYLNGLAFDHLFSHFDELQAKEKEVLQEWNFKKKVVKHLSLREKVLSYQTIILRKTHPPINPTNNSSLKTILELAANFRNPIAHPSPQPDPKSGEPEKEMAIYTISVETARIAVEAAVDLVGSLEELVHGDRTRITWLLGCTRAGSFPEEAFN